MRLNFNMILQALKRVELYGISGVTYSLTQVWLNSQTSSIFYLLLLFGLLTMQGTMEFPYPAPFINIVIVVNEKVYIVSESNLWTKSPSEDLLCPVNY